MRRVAARVTGTTLSADEGTLILEVDTEAWLRWLARREAFSYRDPAYGHLTVRCEKAKQGDRWYWRAYRQCAGKTRSAYLGMTVTLSQLQAAAAKLHCPAPASWEEAPLDEAAFPDLPTVHQAQRTLRHLEQKARWTRRDREAILRIASGALFDLAVAFRLDQRHRE